MSRKYPEANIKLVDDLLRTYMLSGDTYHIAAKKVSKELGIDFSYLRYRAFYMNKEDGIYEHTHMQHRDYTTHGRLIVECKEKLERDGFIVMSEQSEVRRYMLQHGSRGNPDLIAFKLNSFADNANEPLLIEIVENEKAYHTIVDQITRYRKVGKVIVVFPTDTSNVEFWGIQNLSTGSGRTN